MGKYALKPRPSWIAVSAEACGTRTTARRAEEVEQRHADPRRRRAVVEDLEHGGPHDLGRRGRDRAPDVAHRPRIPPRRPRSARSPAASRRDGAPFASPGRGPTGAPRARGVLERDRPRVEPEVDHRRVSEHRAPGVDCRSLAPHGRTPEPGPVDLSGSGVPTSTTATSPAGSPRPSTTTATGPSSRCPATGDGMRCSPTPTVPCCTGERSSRRRSRRAPSIPLLRRHLLLRRRLARRPLSRSDRGLLLPAHVRGHALRPGGPRPPHAGGRGGEPTATGPDGQAHHHGVFSHWDNLDPAWNPGGIWRPVRLRDTGPVRISWLRVLCTEATEVARPAAPRRDPRPRRGSAERAGHARRDRRGRERPDARRDDGRVSTSPVEAPP